MKFHHLWNQQKCEWHSGQVKKAAGLVHRGCPIEWYSTQLNVYAPAESRYHFLCPCPRKKKKCSRKADKRSRDKHLISKSKTPNWNRRFVLKKIYKHALWRARAALSPLGACKATCSFVPHALPPTAGAARGTAAKSQDKMQFIFANTNINQFLLQIKQ